MGASSMRCRFDNVLLKSRTEPSRATARVICRAARATRTIATLVERHSRFTMLVKLEGKDTAGVVTALSKQVRKLRSELRRLLTWDRGMEMAEHKRFTIATDVNVYFCDPQSPWQRGTNENTNRLLRQYFPKGTNLSGHSQSELNKIALLLNQRPTQDVGIADAGR